MTQMLAAFLAVWTSPAAAQTIELECEIENVESLSIGGRQPLRRFYLDMIRATIDLGARTALLRWEAVDGTPQSSIRNLLAATPDEVVMCQADTCQQRVTEPDGWNSTIGLTTINLRTGRLTRRVEGNLPTMLTIGPSQRTIVRDGQCRRVGGNPPAPAPARRR